MGRLGHCETQQHIQIKSLESLAQIEKQFGFPAIRFDGENGVVVVGQPHKDNTNGFAIHTIKIEYDAQGRLIRAEPHPSLGLWNEGFVSVETGDLARLLTLVWV